MVHLPATDGAGALGDGAALWARGLAGARAYLADPVLGARLKQCVAAVLAVEGRSARQIFGTPDDLKFRSSITLFEAAAEDADKPLFAAALERYYDGVRDPLTVEVVGG